MRLKFRVDAFSLVELLVVIGVIAVLMGMIFVAARPAKDTQKISLARSELQQVCSAIESYESDYRAYPPDNPGNALINQLYFELAGTIRSADGSFRTLDGSGRIQSSELVSVFGSSVAGFLNSSSNPKSSDETKSAKNYLLDFKPSQTGAITLGSPIRVLTCSVLSEQVPYPLPGGDPPGINPWRYVSAHPTNNSRSYDLWVDIPVSGKSKRISNWSR